jgi:hypothetical protein
MFEIKTISPPKLRIKWNHTKKLNIVLNNVQNKIYLVLYPLSRKLFLFWIDNL